MAGVDDGRNREEAGLIRWLDLGLEDSAGFVAKLAAPRLADD